MSRTQKILMGVAATLVVLVGLGYFALAKFRQFLYPPAPPMPAEVTATMPAVLANLEGVLRTKAPQVLETLQPGLSSEDIGKLEKQWKIQLPDNIKQLYQWRNGARPMTNLVEDFFPLYRFVPLEQALAETAGIANQKDPPDNAIGWVATRLFAGHRESWICFFDDGSGNGYFYDPKRKLSEGAIFYHYTEDAEYMFFPSIKNVMAGVARCYEKDAFKVKPGTNPVELDENYEAAEKIWTEFGARRQ